MPWLPEKNFQLSLMSKDGSSAPLRVSEVGWTLSEGGATAVADETSVVDHAMLKLEPIAMGMIKRSFETSRTFSSSIAAFRAISLSELRRERTVF